MLAAFAPQMGEMLILPLLLALSLGLGWLLAGPLKRAPAHSPLERLLIYWLVGIIAFSWVGTILAALGLFKWWLVLGVLLALALWVAWRGRQDIQTAVRPESRLQSTPWPALVVLVFALGGAGWLFARPSESFLLSDDSSVYTIGGIVLSRTGSLFSELDAPLTSASFSSPPVDPWDQQATPAESPPTPQTDFLRQFHDIGAKAVSARHYGPFYEPRSDRAILEIGFLPLSKVWSALVVWLLGAGHAAWATPFLGLTGLAALYGLTRRLLSWQAGLMAMTLLAVSLPQVWFARLPISEVYTQALLMGGLYLVTLSRQAQQDSSLARQMSLWSGLSLAALTMLRFEAIFYLLPLVILLCISWEERRLGRDSAKCTWILTILGGSIFGLLLSLGVSRSYLFTVSLSTATPAITRGMIAVLTMFVGGASLAWRYWPRCVQHVAYFSARVRGWLPAIVALCWLLWGLVALWQLCTRAWGSSLAGWLVQYWTRPGLALSVIGAVALPGLGHKRKGHPEIFVFLGLAVFFLALYSVHPMVTPLHPWAMRRTVPVIMPALALCCAGMLTEGVGVLRSLPLLLRRQTAARWTSWTLGTLLFLTLAFSIGQRSYPLSRYQEREGLWRQLEAFVQGFPSRAVFLFDNGQVGTRLTQVMELVFDHPSLVLRDTEAIRSDSSMVDRFIRAAMAQGRPVYLILTDGDLEWRSTNWRLLAYKAQRIDTPTLKWNIWGRPPNVGDLAQHTFWLDSYQILPATEKTLSTPEESTTVEVSAGTGGFQYLPRGFYPFEFDGSGDVFRWTRSEAFITIPWPAETLEAEADFCLELVVCGGRFPEAEPARLVVEAEGVELFRGQLDKAFERRTLRLPVRALVNRNAPQLEVRLACNPWKPADYGAQQDQRVLGIMLYNARLLPACE